MLAANHVSHLDPLLVAEMVLAEGRVPRFLAKDTLFRKPVVGAWFRAAGHVEVDRAAGRAGYGSGRLRWGWRRRVSVVVGPPIPLDDLRGLEPGRAVEVGRQRLAEALVAMVLELSAPDS